MTNIDLVHFKQFSHLSLNQIVHGLFILWAPLIIQPDLIIY